MTMPWNAVWFEYDEHDNITEAHYETLKEPKTKTKSKKIAPKGAKSTKRKGIATKTTRTVRKAKSKKSPVRKAVAKKVTRKVSAKKTTERATFGRLNKILQELGQFVKITEVRHAYQARFHEPLKLSSTTRNRVLVKYDTRYENLVFHSRKRKLVVA